ncbi:unnamed protein product [Ectocarpus sp. 12 AP-2014]
MVVCVFASRKGQGVSGGQSYDEDTRAGGDVYKCGRLGNFSSHVCVSCGDVSRGQCILAQARVLRQGTRRHNTGFFLRRWVVKSSLWHTFWTGHGWIEHRIKEAVVVDYRTRHRVSVDVVWLM